MCGRYTLKTAPPELGDVFREFNFPPALDWHPSFNFAPSQSVLVVPNDGEATARTMAWGLVPSWARDPKGYQINARAETAAEKPFFRTAFKKRRCVVFADGFYEWAPAVGKAGKVPWHFALAGGEPFAIAGLWDVWRSPDGEERPGVALLTTEANALVGRVHGRMPVILGREAFSAWLAPGEADPAFLSTLLTPTPPEAMRAWPVSKLVNLPRNDGPELVKPAALRRSDARQRRVRGARGRRPERRARALRRERRRRAARRRPARREGRRRSAVRALPDVIRWAVTA